MTINQLASKVAKLEGKKSQARVGDIREILGILADMVVSGDVGFDLITILGQAGLKRAKRRPKTALK